MRKLWTTEELDYLKSAYPDMATHKIASKLSRTTASVYAMAGILKLSKSEEFKKSPISGRITPGSKMGGLTTFKKGQVSFNKGLKQTQFMSPQAIERSKATRFKKGHAPHNTKPENGVITVRKCKGRPYKYIRLAQARWRELHRVIWEQNNGPVPKGFNVQFKDRDPLNCAIENLYLIKRTDQMKHNSIHNYPEDIKKTIRTLATLKRKIKRHEKQD